MAHFIRHLSLEVIYFKTIAHLSEEEPSSEELFESG